MVLTECSLVQVIAPELPGGPYTHHLYRWRWLCHCLKLPVGGSDAGRQCREINIYVLFHVVTLKSRERKCEVLFETALLSHLRSAMDNRDTALVGWLCEPR